MRVYTTIESYNQAASAGRSAEWAKTNGKAWDLVSWVIAKRRRGEL